MTQAKKEEILKEIKTKLREIEVRVKLLEGNLEEVYTEEEPVNQNNEVVHEIQISDAELEIRITKYFRQIGIPANLKGYNYVRQAIFLVIKDKEDSDKITKDIYPKIAENSNDTYDRVERAIRHAIAVAWKRGNSDLQEKIFGYTISTDKGKPTSAEFIRTVADYIVLELKKQGFTL